MKCFLKKVLILILLAFASCGSNKRSATAGTTEIILPITNFDSDKTFIRSISNGTSPNMSFAKELAFKNAVTDIARRINVNVKNLMEDYTKQAEIDATQDYKSEVESMTKLSVDQSLKNVTIAKEKIFKNPDNSYTYWVGVQVNKEELFSSLSNKISASKIKALHEDKLNFRETFDKNFEEK